jgi:hypothetical protein
MFLYALNSFLSLLSRLIKNTDSTKLVPHVSQRAKYFTVSNMVRLDAKDQSFMQYYFPKPEVKPDRFPHRTVPVSTQDHQRPLQLRKFISPENASRKVCDVVCVSSLKKKNINNLFRRWMEVTHVR